MDNIETALDALHTIEQKDTELTKWFGDIKISTIPDQKNYEEILGSAKIALKKINVVQDNLISPLEEGIKRIKALFKPKIDEYTTAISQISEGLNIWHTSQKQLTETQITQQAEDYWARKKEADQTGEIIPLPDLGSTPVASTSKHNMGSTNYRPHVKVTIVTPNLVPREYCVPAESLLRKAGELALAQDKPMPHIEGTVIEVGYTPVSRSVK